MKIIVDIPAGMFDWIQNGFPDEVDADFALKAIRNGEPLEETEKEENEMHPKHWLNVELNKAEANYFRFFCKANEIRYEASGAGNLIHFEVYVTESEKELCNAFLLTM